MAETDLDQAAMMWSEIVQKKEELLAGEKGGEKDKQDNQETLARLRLAMTQRLAQREEIELVDGVDLPSLPADMMDLEDEDREVVGGGDTEVKEGENREKEKEKKKREWRERPGAGMSAGKRQRLAQDQDENLIRALEAQDEKAGKMYQETLTAGIDKLVNAIANAGNAIQPGESIHKAGYDRQEEEKREKRLTEHERKLNQVMEEQKIIQQKLDDSVTERAEAEKRSEARQEKMMELLQLLTNK